MRNEAHRIVTRCVRHLATLVMAMIIVAWGSAASSADSLERGWTNPPKDSRVRAYWWWINGNVTREAITRDLEQMKSKGFAGALICDADGSSQDGNDRAPHGPTFFSAEWRELYKHTLREADRLGLEMSLNIQSGWNLGGPMVTAEDAPKKLVWTEATVTADAPMQLVRPKARDNFYRDLFVVAYPVRKPAQANQSKPAITASSNQPEHPASKSVDGTLDTFWVSAGNTAGGGPIAERPQWLLVSFDAPVAVQGLNLIPRPNYGPKDCELQASTNGKEFTSLKIFTAVQSGETTVRFPVREAQHFRLLIKSAFDPSHPNKPRNVQIAELVLIGKDGEITGKTVSSTLQNQREKALLTPLRPFSAPDSSPLFQETPSTPGEQDAMAKDVVDLTGRMGDDGKLQWNPPAGEWVVLRIGYTLNDHCRVSTCSQGWEGYALDPFDDGAFHRYWNAVVEPLILDAGPLAGKALKYLHTDSWEVEVANWTPSLRKEFKARRGYDLLPWLPVIAGKILNSREESNRFLHDFRRTMGDLAIDNHYKLFKAGAHKHGLLIHPESGGPHAVPIDAQQCLGFNDAPMSEFWAWSWRHRVGDENRFFVKQPASAAHVYGHKLVLAEGFTTIGPHWQETIWDNLKPSFDFACTEGLNVLVWHAFVCSPESEGIPGQQYFAGTHLNPLVTWWDKSGPFFEYMNRCQFMLQQGLFVADAAYYYGDHVPNFTQLRRSDPARLGAGYDYDVLTAEALLTRAKVRDGRIVLPDGMSYAVLVLPDRDVISLPVLRKLKEFAEAGATIVGPKPQRSISLADYSKGDAELKKIADSLWGSGEPSKPGIRKAGNGRVVPGQTGREVLLASGIKPDFEWKGVTGMPIHYIHRRRENADIYFVANRSNVATEASCTFRVSGRVPELWNAVTGERRRATAYEQSEGRTTVPLNFDPCGSWFVVFREKAASSGQGSSNSMRFEPITELQGSWTVTFDPKWGGPGAVQFDKLVSWPTRSEPQIRFFSGTAVYETEFEVLAGSGKSVWIDLGNVRELAEVKVNRQSCGITWTPPFRVELTRALRPGKNKLAVEVVNFWPNRIIGDAALPKDQRLTRTNIRKLTAETPLMESGLMGPVRLVKPATE
jgi:hypothetical protein